MHNSMPLRSLVIALQCKRKALECLSSAHRQLQSQNKGTMLSNSTDLPILLTFLNSVITDGTSAKQ
jgi:hypothetical protein